MNPDRSLLSYLDAPVVVGDPEGRAVYVNPAFEAGFEGAALGVPLAELFEGGAREAVLRAVAAVCERGESLHFRLRERNVGYSAVASPIESGGDQVGVLILFKEEVAGAERLIAIHRELQGPLEEIGSALDTLLEQTGGRRNPHHRLLVEDAVRGLSRIRKWVDEAQSIVTGTPRHAVRSDRIDVLDAVREAARRSRPYAERRGVAVDVLLPATLPAFPGDEGRLVAALVRLAEARMDCEPSPERLLWTARQASRSDRSVLIGVTEQRAGGYAEPFADPASLSRAIASLGAELHGQAHRALGRTTLIRLPIA